MNDENTNRTTKQDEEARTAMDSMVALEALLDIRNRRDPLPPKRNASDDRNSFGDNIQNSSVSQDGSSMTEERAQCSGRGDQPKIVPRSGSAASVMVPGANQSLTLLPTVDRTADDKSCMGVKTSTATSVSPVPTASSAAQVLPLSTGSRPTLTTGAASSSTHPTAFSPEGPINPSDVLPSPVLFGLTAHQALAVTPSATRMTPSVAASHKTRPNDSSTETTILQPRAQQGASTDNPNVPTVSTTATKQSQIPHQHEQSVPQSLSHSLRASTTTVTSVPGPPGFMNAGGAVSFLTHSGQGFLFGGTPQILPPHQLLMTAGGVAHAPNAAVFLAGTPTLPPTPPAALTAVLTPQQINTQQPAQKTETVQLQHKPAPHFQTSGATSNQNPISLQNQQPSPLPQITMNPTTVSQQAPSFQLPTMPFPPKAEVASVVDAPCPPKFGVVASAVPARSTSAVTSVTTATPGNAHFMSDSSGQPQKKHPPHPQAKSPPPPAEASTSTLQEGKHTSTIRAEEVQAALRSKPQRGRKRENLSAVERLELTRTRNREHAKSTRVRKKARYEELLQSEATLESLKRRDDLANRRRHVVVNLLAMRSAVMRRIVQDGGEVIEASVESVLFGGSFRTSNSPLFKGPTGLPTQPTLDPLAPLSSESAAEMVAQGLKVTTEETASNEIAALSTRSVSFQDAEVRASVSPPTDLGDNSTSQGMELPYQVTNPASILDILEDAATFRFVKLRRIEGPIGDNADSGDTSYQGLRDMVKFDADMVNTARSRTAPNQHLHSVRYHVVNATEGVALTVKDVGYAEYEAEAESVCSDATIANQAYEDSTATLPERPSHDRGGSTTVVATVTTDVIGGLAVGKSVDSEMRGDSSGLTTMSTMNVVISAGVLRVEFPPDSHKIRSVGWCSAAESHPPVASACVDTESSRERARASPGEEDILDRQKTFPSIISLEHQLMQDVSAHSTNESEHRQDEDNAVSSTTAHGGNSMDTRHCRQSFGYARKSDYVESKLLESGKTGKTVAGADGMTISKKRHDDDSATTPTGTESRVIHTLRISSSSSLSIGNPNCGARTASETDREESSPMQQHQQHHHDPSVLSTPDEDHNGPGMNIYFDG